MSDCTFTLNFTGTADDLFAKMTTQITAHGGTISGDATGGSFTVHALGTINGTYTIAAPTLTVDITSKPALVSCGIIQHFVQDQLT